MLKNNDRVYSIKTIKIWFKGQFLKNIKKLGFAKKSYKKKIISTNH